MPIGTDCYRPKSIELQRLLQNNPQASEQLGRELLRLIRTGWRQYNHSPLKPFGLSALINPVYGFFENDPTQYEEFAQRVITLLQEENLNDFLIYFRNIAIQQANDPNFPPAGAFAGDANGWYAATFFLMLNNPNNYLVNLRRPNRQNHPLVDLGITDQNTINAIGNFNNQNGYDITLYENLITNIIAYKNNNNLAGDFIDFIDYIEIPLPQPQNILTKNTILYGPPGTGKTFNTINESLKIIDSAFFENNQNNRQDLKSRFDELVEEQQIHFVTFHQSYSYEEFVEGIRAKTDNNSNISYKVESGIFKEICQTAENNPDKNYVLIIDEINRGNISKIFGELITLIEDSKRQGENEELTVTLPYSGDSFSVPRNLYIIGTMNTADRSLALMDTALRRRFQFIEMMPKPAKLNGIQINGINIQQMLEVMNQRIEVLYDREHTLGHAFFMPLITQPNIENLAGIFENKIVPLLQEYFFEDWEKIGMVLGDDKPNKTSKFIVKNNIPQGLFVNQDKVIGNGKEFYSINTNAFSNANSYEGIYA